MINDVKSDPFMRQPDRGPRSEEKSARGAREKGLFENELAQVKSERERGGSKVSPAARRKDREESSARNERTENLWSQKGTGSESRLRDLKSERKSERDEPAEDTRISTSKSAQLSAEPVHDSSENGESENKEVSKDVNEDANEDISHEARQEPKQELRSGSTGSLHAEGMTAVSHAARPLGNGESAAELKSEKQKAMNEFMDQMQTEFGIPPGKILEAFDQMDMKSLTAPPEQTAGEFAKGLSRGTGLKPEQMARVKNLYAAMLDQTGAADLGEKQLELQSQNAAAAGAAPELAVAMQKLNESIEDLNQSFAPGDQKPEDMMAAISRLANLNQAQGPQPERKGKGDKEAAQGLALKAVAFSSAAAIAASQNSPIAGSALNESDASPDLQDASALLSGREGAGAQLASLSGNGNALDSAAGSSSKARAAVKTASASRVEMDQAIKMALKSSGDESATSGGKDIGLKNGQSIPGDSNLEISSTQGAVTGASTHRTGESAAQGAALGAAIPGVKLSSQEQEENMREVVKQAQLIVKKGGGEMNLELRPEGIGQVHLKVSVENGQVSVQMLAESDAAKKMLEDGMHELKASLNAHKLQVDTLKVDTLKVDVGADIRKHMDQQGGQDAGREHARQFAQDFMQQFRDEREGFGRGFGENAGLRSYPRGPKRADVQPDAVSMASLRGASAAQGGSSRRLNLVA